MKVMKAQRKSLRKHEKMNEKATRRKTKRERGAARGASAAKNMQKPKNHTHATPNAAIGEKQESAPLAAINKKYQRRLQ